MNPHNLPAFDPTEFNQKELLAILHNLYARHHSIQGDDVQSEVHIFYWAAYGGGEVWSLNVQRTYDALCDYYRVNDYRLDALYPYIQAIANRISDVGVSLADERATALPRFERLLAYIEEEPPHTAGDLARMSALRFVIDEFKKG